MPDDAITTTMRIDRPTLAALDAWAQAHGLTRSAAWHVLVRLAMRALEADWISPPLIRQIIQEYEISTKSTKP